MSPLDRLLEHVNTRLPPVSVTSSLSPAAGSSGPGPPDLSPGSAWGPGSGSPGENKFNYITYTVLLTQIYSKQHS